MLAINEYAQKIAEICQTSPEIILDILRLSEEHKVIYHGVKNRDSLESVLGRGIEPRTPESGYTSWWGVGLKLFLNNLELPLHKLSTYDTPFFHYAHNDRGMSLVVTDQQTLKNHDIDVAWQNHSQINIKQVIPSSALSLLDITFDGLIVDQNDTRKYSIKMENIMLHNLLKHLSDYSVGKRICANITL
jgi:hypothetical protein